MKKYPSRLPNYLQCDGSGSVDPLLLASSMVFMMALAFTGGFNDARAQTPASPDSLEESEPWSPWAMTSAEIRSTGAVRLSELFRMMPAIETWSSDRYTHRLVGLGLGGLHPRGPEIRLDGVALPAYLLDRTLTESLPVSPGEISTLVYDPTLRISHTARYADGRLSIQTPMVAGWHVKGAMAVINETGDPGPGRHTDARRNNVDRSGPATWVRVGWGNGTWLVQSGLNTDLHHLTDERISGRVRGTYAEDVQPVITQFAPFARIRYRGVRSNGHLLGGHSRRKDFIFHESTGREWPARLHRTWGAARFDREGERLRLDVEADGSRLSFDDRPSFIRLPPAIALDEAALSGRLSIKLDSWTMSLSTGIRTWQIDQTDRRLARTIPSAGVGLDWQSRRWAGRMGVLLAYLDDPLVQPSTSSIQVSTTVSRTGNAGGVVVSLAGNRGHFPEAGRLERWIQAGLDLGDWLSAPEWHPPDTVPQTAEFRLRGRRFLSRGWTGWADVHVRYQDGLLLTDRTIDQRFGIGPFLPVWTLSAPHSGWLFSRSAGIERQEPDGIAWRAFLQFYHVSSEGDDAYFRHQTGFPRHRIQVMASDERPGGVRWVARIGYVSAWTWPEYREPARKDIPADIIAEATIGKTLFSGNADALISLLNIPNRAIGNHPAGVEEQLAIRLTLSLIPGSRGTARDEAR